MPYIGTISGHSCPTLGQFQVTRALHWDSSRSLVPYIGTVPSHSYPTLGQFQVTRALQYIGTVPGVVVSCTGPVSGATVPRIEADGNA